MFLRVYWYVHVDGFAYRCTYIYICVYTCWSTVCNCSPKKTSHNCLTLSSHTNGRGDTEPQSIISCMYKHTATHFNTQMLGETLTRATHCNTLQHTVTHKWQGRHGASIDNPLHPPASSSSFELRIAYVFRDLRTTSASCELRDHICAHSCCVKDWCSHVDCHVDICRCHVDM